jgi:uncharacterized membrane protein YoaK (UPF0700 family)
VLNHDESLLVRALMTLTVVTGLIDAVSFLELGHIFTANMTGNIVFLGFAAGGAPGVSAARSLTALAAFAGGSVCGGRLTAIGQRTAIGHLLLATCLETVLIAAAAIAAMFAGREMPRAIAYSVIVLTAVAMGLRNAVVRKLAVPDLTTTVLTMTVTGLSADSRPAGGSAPRAGRRALSVVAMLSGAFVGAVLLRRVGVSGALALAAMIVGGLSVYLQRMRGRDTA